MELLEHTAGNIPEFTHRHISVYHGKRQRRTGAEALPIFGYKFRWVHKDSCFGGLTLRCRSRRATVDEGFDMGQKGSSEVGDLKIRVEPSCELLFPL